MIKWGSWFPATEWNKTFDFSNFLVKLGLYRGDTKLNNGFYVAINRKFLNLKSNLIEVRIIDSPNGLVSIAYKAYVKR